MALPGSQEKCANLNASPKENSDQMDAKIRDYYKFQAALLEPWDGPALVCVTDGDGVGAHVWDTWVRRGTSILPTNAVNGTPLNFQQTHVGNYPNHRFMTILSLCTSSLVLQTRTR